MGRSPSSSKEEPINRGAWSAQEDKVLVDYITTHGEGRWRSVPKKAGLNRCGRSCRLRWLNYLRPNIKRGNISADEEDLIIRLHRLLGNRWSLIAGRLPGRTDNEIKNYWNTKLSKKLQQAPNTPSIHRNDRNPIKPQNPSEKVRENGSGLMSPPPLQSKVPPLTESGSVSEEVSAPKERHDETTGQNHGCPPPESHREDEDGRKSEKEFMDVISGEQSCWLSDPLDSRLFWGPDKEEEDAKNEGRREVDGDGVRGYVSVTVNEGSRFGWAAATNELTWDEDLGGLGLDSDMAVFLDNGYGYWDSALGWI